MELNRRQVPLYGQVVTHVLLQYPDIASEETECYVVLEGSRLTHVTEAKRTDDGMCFTVPGHDLPEVVSVTSYFHTEGGVKPCRGGPSLEYVTDIAQEVAEYLGANSDRLSPQSYLEVLRRVSTRKGDRDKSGCHYEELSPVQSDQDDEGVLIRASVEDEAGLRELDEKITQAMANMDYPQHWKSTGSQAKDDILPAAVQDQLDHVAELQLRETLLHLAVRLGLLHLSCFLIRQPRGQRALTLPNQEGDTPLQLAQRSGEHALLRVLTTPPVPAVGVCCVWSDGPSILRFSPSTGSLSLSVRQSAGTCPLDSVLVLRDRLRDQAVLKQITMLRGEADAEEGDKEETHASDGDFSKELHVEEHALMDSVFEEQLVLSLDDDDEDVELPVLLAVKGHSVQSSEVQSQSTQCAAVPLVSMIHSRDQAHTDSAQLKQGQVDDVDVKYSVSGVTSDSTATDGRAWDTVESEVVLLATDTPPPQHPLQSEDFQPLSLPLSNPLSSPVSSPDLVLPRLNHPAFSDLDNHRESLPLATCDLSPSLVALEVDSEEEESAEVKSPVSHLSSEVRCSRDERDTFNPSPDLTCTRTLSASSACDPAPSKDMGDLGIRLRSYSYSSPKISLRRPRFTRDTSSTAASDLSPEQRASSLPEHPQEKREMKFRKRAQSADDEDNADFAESLQHLTLSEFLKEIEEEDWDKYNIPSKVESEKYKVIRTFSFLKSRMSSTRNKSKGKGKDRETKDKETKDRHLNGHRFSTGSCVGPTICFVCDKPASGKDLLHCSSCTVMVHKGCKESAPPCLKKLQDKYAVTMVKNRTASLPQNFTIRDNPTQCIIPTSNSLPTPKEKRDPVPLSRSVPSASDRLSESSEAESDSWRAPGQSEELLHTAESSTSTDSSLGEDCVDSCLHSDLSADAVDYEAESWSLTVEHKFCKKQEKRMVKRQDVIYELMQTEIHHLQTLHIMAEVFRRGMREEVQLDAEAVGRLFPCLDQLLLFHHALFAAMRERRHSSAQPHGHRNYLIQRIGDILLQQFSDENAERMKQVYGEFCSHHNEAVSFFKELQQHNKRFQNFIKQQSNNSLVRRREIPECILLVTQRITKYPVLLERILQYTQGLYDHLLPSAGSIEATEEHADLSKALVQIREVIVAVDLRVSEYEQDQRLQEVLSRMENRSSAKLKNGHTFRKQDVMGPGRTLKHQGMLLWKTATGRLKDVLALLLTDTLIFLQEKDQKYSFAAVDQKPPIISLQKLIVREVANEERGMFLISASAAGPEMYEVHASSKDERNTWMRLIREAVESCPEEEEEFTSESEEEKRAAEARIQKIHKLQESLTSQDQQICSSLEEKLQIYAELSALSGRMEEPRPEPRLLVQPHPEEAPQAAGLLAAALREAENLRATLSSRTCSPSSPGQDSQIDHRSPVSPLTPQEPRSDSEASPGDQETREGVWTASEALVLQSLTHLQKGDPNNINLKVAQSVQSLTQLLYSLQAAVTIQDSCYEVQRLLLRESERPSPRSQRPHPPCVRGNALQEQEKQRNLEKRREEVAAAQRLQGRLRQERQRWERECQARQSQQGEQESRLEERERQCHLEAEKLKREREELEEQLEEYQQSLERLREGQRSVEREREKLETQQKLLQTWRHSHQRSLPAVMPTMVIPLDGQQDSVPSHSGGGHADDGSVFVNEAAFTSTTLNNRHLHHRGDDPSAHNSLNTLLARSNHRQHHSVPKTPQLHTDSRALAMGTGYFYTPTGGLGEEHTPSDLNSHGYVREAWSSTVTGADQYLGLPRPSDPQLDLSVLVSLETGSGEEGGEENIVYL